MRLGSFARRSLALAWLAAMQPACGGTTKNPGSTSAAGAQSSAGSESAGSGNPGGSGSDAAGSNSGQGGAVSAGGKSGGPGEPSDGGDGPTPLVDPAPGEYAEAAALPAANSEMAVAELAGKIYVLGGYPSSRQVQSAVQVYDTALDSWQLSVPLPLPLHHPVAVGVAGRVLSFGGQLADDSGSAGDDATDRTLAFDPSEPGAGWIDLEPMPTARGGGAAAVIGSKVYVVGGRPPAGNAFEVYDVEQGTWTPLADLPQEYPDRNHLAAAAIDGKVYVAGGRYMGGSFSSPLTDSLDIYDPVGGSWSKGAPMLRPRGGVNGVAINGCFHVWGGEGADTGFLRDVFPQHDLYAPGSDEWTALADLPTPIHGVTGAAVVGGLIYMPGGGTMQGGNSGSTLFQVYRPEFKCVAAQ